MLHFRPHHFMCTLGFAGYGYSPKFIENFTKIKESIDASRGNEIQIKIVSGLDAICLSCPLNQGDKCQTQSKVAKLDQGHAKALGIEVDQIITWEKAKKLIQERISINRFNEICSECSWQRMGVCKKALKKLKREMESEFN